MHLQRCGMAIDIAPPDHKHFRTADTWQVGLIFSRIKPGSAFGLEHLTAEWFDHQIRLSVRPNEAWEDAYVRQFGALPEARLLCFTLTAM